MTEQSQIFGQQLRGAGRAVAHDDDVDAHGLDVLGRVDERFAFREAAAGGGEIDRVGAQPPHGQRKAGAGAGGGLEEQVGQVRPVQDRDLFLTAAGGFFELSGGVENEEDLFGGETFEIQ